MGRYVAKGGGSRETVGDLAESDFLCVLMILVKEQSYYHCIMMKMNF